MPIPLNYNLRNLFVRRTTTVMTMSGIALTVAVFLAALALVNGLRATLESTGSPLNLLVLRKGSTTELNSAIREDVYRDMLFNAGIAHLSNSESPAASLELVTVVNLPRPGSLGGESTALRGVLPVGIELRNLRLQDGRWFQPGQREIVVGASVALRCADARVGKRLRIGNSEWQVVGIMDGGHSAVNSEIFADLNQVSTDFNRREQYSSVLVRAASASAISALANSFDNDPRLNVKTQSEQDYYARQTAPGTPMLQLGLLVAFIMAIGSSFAAMTSASAGAAKIPVSAEPGFPPELPNDRDGSWPDRRYARARTSPCGTANQPSGWSAHRRHAAAIAASSSTSLWAKVRIIRPSR